MYTQCPGCQTIFEIDEDALQASLGIVRCGHCSERFDALRTLSSTLPPGPDNALPVHDPEEHAPTLTASVWPEARFGAAEAHHAANVEAAAAAAPGNMQEPDARADDEWLHALSGRRAQVLIADAAGIPHEAVQGDPAWEIIELPVQTGFMDLDSIAIEPVSRAVESSRDAVPADAPTADEPLASNPPDESWVIEISDAERTDPTAPAEPAQDGAETLASDPPATTPGEKEATATHPTDDEFHPPAEPVGAQSTESGDPTDDCDLREPDRVDFEQDDTVEPHQQEWADDTPEIDADETLPATPVYVPPRRRRIRRSDWLWVLGCALLAVLLAAQLGWAKRVAFIRDPATQAWAMRVCASLDCRLPPIRDIAKLELLSRDIRPDPDAAGALMITATLRNDARFRQPWPIVVVELTDLDNNVVAMRRFRPAEYMPDPARRTTGIAPGTTAAVAFEVADPGKRAVSFHFGFE